MVKQSKSLRESVANYDQLADALAGTEWEQMLGEWLRIDFSILGPLSVLRWHAWIVKLPLFFAITIGVAALSHKYFERPILRLKDRWFPTGQATATQPPLQTQAELPAEISAEAV